MELSPPLELSPNKNPCGTIATGDFFDLGLLGVFVFSILLIKKRKKRKSVYI